EPADELVGVGELRGTDDRVAAGAGPRIGDVLGDAGREQYRLPEHDGELPAQVGQSVIAEVISVHQHTAAPRIVEADQEVHERALARTGPAHDADTRACRPRERDVPNGVTVAVVRERDTVEDDVAPRPRDAQ